MTLLELAATILFLNKTFGEFEVAKDHVFSTFKSEFPFWSFSEWNSEVSIGNAKSILRIYEEMPVSVKELILDLPGLVSALKESAR